MYSRSCCCCLCRRAVTFSPLCCLHSFDSMCFPLPNTHKHSPFGSGSIQLHAKLAHIMVCVPVPVPVPVVRIRLSDCCWWRCAVSRCRCLALWMLLTYTRTRCGINLNTEKSNFTKSEEWIDCSSTKLCADINIVWWTFRWFRPMCFGRIRISAHFTCFRLEGKKKKKIINE